MLAGLFGPQIWVSQSLRLLLGGRLREELGSTHHLSQIMCDLGYTSVSSVTGHRESIFITSLADSLSVSNDTGHCTVNSGLCPGPVSAMSVMVLCHTPTLSERDCVQMTSTRYKARR